MSTPTFELPYGTVTGQYIVIKHDGADEDHLPDVQPLNGSVLLTPTVTAGGVAGALAEIAPVRLRIFGGQIVDEQQNPGARILANDADMAVEDWAWKAQVTFEDSKLRLKPQTFKLATGETVSLTSGLIPVDSAPYQLVQGKPGESAYEVAVRHGYTGTETQWLESLKGDGSAWADIEGKPSSYPSTIPDVQGLTDRLAALDEKTLKRSTGLLDVTALAPDIERVGAQGGLLVSRVGDLVQVTVYSVRFKNVPTPPPSSLDFGWRLPVGFRPITGTLLMVPVIQGTTGMVRFRLISSGQLVLYSHDGANAVFGSATFATTDPWPTVLPGSPV